VQIDAYAAMTGASLFTHVRERFGDWTYDRSEDLAAHYSDLGAFDYLVTSTPRAYDGRHFRPITAAFGFAGLRRWRGLPVGPKFEAKVWVLERIRQAAQRL
jgi:hypothetical protein